MELQLPEQGKILLYVGLFIDRKGVDELVKTVSIVRKQLDDVFLVIVGHEMPDLLENSLRFNEEESARSCALCWRDA